MAESLVVIRSGTTDYELQGRIRGTLDIPLAPEGLADARAAAARRPTSICVRQTSGPSTLRAGCSHRPSMRNCPRSSRNV
ncbi:MAG: hypothetical protein EBR28_00805 [Planctomycetia bacterium]|nr:hypothetical protein [Planctomycetia bacterium]